MAQRHAARQRADARRRAATRHVAARLHRPAQPGRALVGLTLVVITLVVGGVLAAGGLLVARHEIEGGPRVTVHAPAAVAIPTPPGAWSPPYRPTMPMLPSSRSVGSAGAAASAVDDDGGASTVLRALLVNSHRDPAGQATLEAIDEATERYERDGYAILDDEMDAIARCTVLLPRWAEGDRTADRLLEDVLEEHRFAAVLWITSGGREDDDVKVTFLHSERPDAPTRTMELEPAR